MQNDFLLAQKLRAVTDAELTRSAKADVDFAAACVDLILDLDGIEPETDEEVQGGVEAVLQRRTRQRRRWRSLLIAAIVTLLIVSLSVSMMPMGTNDQSLIEKWSLFLLQQGTGSRKDFGDYLTLGNNGETLQFKSIRQFVRGTGLDVLVPTALPKGYTCCKVLVSLDSLLHCPYVCVIMSDPYTQGITIYVGHMVDKLEDMEKTAQIGTYFCGISEFQGGYQGNFNADGNGYCVKAKTMDDLRFIIEHMQSGQEVYG